MAQYRKGRLLETEMNNLKQQLTAREAAAAAQAALALQQYQERVQQWQADKQQKLQLLKSEVKRLESIYGAEREALQQQLDRAGAEREASQQQLEGALAEKEDIQQQLNRAGAEKEDMQQQLNRAGAEREASQQQLEGALAEKEDMQQQLNRAGAEKEDMQQQLNRAGAEKGDMQQQLEGAEAEKAAVQQQLLGMKQQLATAHARAGEYCGVLDQYVERIRQLKGDRKQLQSSVDKEGLTRQQLVQIKQKLAAAEAAINERDPEVEELQVDWLARGEAIKQLKATRKQLKAEVKQLQSSNAQLASSVQQGSAHRDQMVPLAIVGANLLGLKQAQGGETLCSHETLGQGQGGLVRRGMCRHDASSKAEPLALKVIDESWAYHADRGFNGMYGPQSEPALNAAAAGAREKMAATFPWNATSAAAAGGGGGVLCRGGLLGLASSMVMKLMPLPYSPAGQQQLQQHLDKILARPARFENDGKEEAWFRKRDAAAQSFMKSGGCKSQLCLLLVTPLADGGSMDKHVAKPHGGFNGSATGALTRDEVLFIMLYLVHQHTAYIRMGLISKDVKPANIFMVGGLAQSWDWGLGYYRGLAQWAIDFDLASSMMEFWGGSSGYVLKDVAAAEEVRYTAEELKRPAVFETMAAADGGGLCLSCLDLATGQPRSSLIKSSSSSSSNRLLRGTEPCRVVPPGLVKLLPEKVVECLTRVVRDGETAGDRVKAFNELKVALEEAVKQQAVELGITIGEFVQIELLKVQQYFEVNKP